MVKIFFLLAFKYDWKEDKEGEARKCMFFFEKLNIMCSDTCKNVFDKFMIGRNSESKKI